MLEAITLKPRKLGKVSAAVGAVIGLGLGLSVAPSTIAAAERPAKTVELTPNMSGFHKLGNKKIDKEECYNGGYRPCYLLLREAPELDSDIITADPYSPPARSKQWPKESYEGKLGNKLTIVCYDPDGEVVTPYEGNSASTDWYEVEVPKSRILNPAVEQTHHAAMLGWASVEWFNQSKPIPNVPVCAS